jgi:hypothetical protein
MEMIRCPRCAKEIPDVSRFCRRCGSAVAWRAAMPGVVVPPPRERVNRATTLMTVTTPRATRKESIITAGRKPNSGSGAGAFAILAAVGMVCFVNLQVRRGISLPATAVPTPMPHTVRYPLPAPPRAPRISPPVSYPIPLRSTAPTGAVRPPLPPSPPSGSIIIIEPPAAPWQWDDEEQQGRSARDQRTGTHESTPPNRYERRPASR